MKGAAEAVSSTWSSGLPRQPSRCSCALGERAHRSLEQHSCLLDTDRCGGHSPAPRPVVPALELLGVGPAFGVDLFRINKELFLELARGRACWLAFFTRRLQEAVRSKDPLASHFRKERTRLARNPCELPRLVTPGHSHERIPEAPVDKRDFAGNKLGGDNVRVSGQLDHHTKDLAALWMSPPRAPDGPAGDEARDARQLSIRFEEQAGILKLPPDFSKRSGDVGRHN